MPNQQTKFLSRLDRLESHLVKDTKRTMRLYIRRWECEIGIRFSKYQISLEKIRAFSWSAICRLALLAVLLPRFALWLVVIVGKKRYCLSKKPVPKTILSPAGSFNKKLDRNY